MTQPSNLPYQIIQIPGMQTNMAKQQEHSQIIETFESKCNETLSDLLRKVSSQHYLIKTNYNNDKLTLKNTKSYQMQQNLKQPLLFQFHLTFGKFDRVQISRKVQAIGGRVIFDWVPGSIIVIDDQLLNDFFRQNIEPNYSNNPLQNLKHDQNIPNQFTSLCDNMQNRYLRNHSSTNDVIFKTQSSFQDNSNLFSNRNNFGGSQEQMLQNQINLKLNKRQQRLLQNCATSLTSNQFQRNLSANQVGQLQKQHIDIQQYEQISKMLFDQEKIIIKYQQFKILKKFIKTWNTDWFLKKDVTGKIKYFHQKCQAQGIFALVSLQKLNGNNHEIIMEEFPLLQLKQGQCQNSFNTFH